MNVIVPFLALFPLISNGAFQSVSSKTIYNEFCQPVYQLEIFGNSARLVSTKSNNIVEKWSIKQCPYLQAETKYGVYVESADCRYKHVGVLDDILFDLDNLIPINIEDASRGHSIYDVLETIQYSQIPSNAIRCDFPYYFEHLPTTAYGDNIHGTCCIISMQILCDYYDAIFEENLIESIYDNSSTSSALACNLFGVSPGSKGDNFHSYLIQLCNGYCHLDVEDGNGLSWINQNHFINYYVGSIRNVSYVNNTSEGNWSDIFSGRQFGVVRDGISSGRPVILNNLSHSMVSFAYDDTYVYVMTGWRNCSIARMTWDSYNGNIFSNLCSAYDLILNGVHACTESYYSSSLGRWLCPTCGD